MFHSNLIPKGFGAFFFLPRKYVIILIKLEDTEWWMQSPAFMSLQNCCIRHIRGNLTTRLACSDCRGVSLTQAKLPRGNKPHVCDAKTGLTNRLVHEMCSLVVHCPKRQKATRVKEQLSYKTLAFQGWVSALEACRRSHGRATPQCMFCTEARRRNSLDRSEEQTGQDQSVDEADIDPVSPTGLWRSIHMWCFSRAFISFLWNESSVSLHVQQEVL